jgi:hypothetical protein
MNLERLTKIADHLEHGNLGHQVFDFENYNDSPDSNEAPVGCGTNGCALGEFPIIFPNEWEFIGRHINLKQQDRHTPTAIQAAAFLNLESVEVHALFYPTGYPKPHIYMEINGIEFYQLPYNATRYDVAANIRKFINAKRGLQI